MSQNQLFIWKNMLGGPIICLRWNLWGSPGWANSSSHVDEVSDMAPTCQSCGPMVIGFRKGTMASASLSVSEKDVPQLSAWCQTLQFLPICYWCLLSYYPSAGAQMKWLWVSPCVGSSRGTAWDSTSFFHWLNPAGICIQKLTGLIFLALKPCVGGPGVRLRLFFPKISLQYFYPHVDVGPGCSASQCLHVSYQLRWMWLLSFCSCQTSIQLNFWWFWVMVVLFLVVILTWCTRMPAVFI